MVDFVVVMQSLEKFKSQFYGFSLSNSKSASTISRDWNIFSPFLFLSGSFLHKKRLASWLIPSRKLQSWKWESSPFLAETRSGNRVVFSKNFKHIKIWRHMPNFQSTMQSLHLYVYNNILFAFRANNRFSLSSRLTLKYIAIVFSWPMMMFTEISYLSISKSKLFSIQ